MKRLLLFFGFRPQCLCHKRQFLFIETVNHDKYRKYLNHDTDLYVNLSTSESLLSMHRQTQISLDFRQVNITYLCESLEMFKLDIPFLSTD